GLVVANVPLRLGEAGDEPSHDVRVVLDEVPGGRHVQVVPEVPATPDDDVGPGNLLQHHRPEGLPRRFGIDIAGAHHRDLVGRGDVHKGDAVGGDPLPSQHGAKV